MTKLDNDSIFTDKEKSSIGESIIEVLGLKQDRSENYNPKRYVTAWGSKTALGIYETVKQMVEE